MVIVDVKIGAIARREATYGTIGFVSFGKALGKFLKGLMGMLSLQGNSPLCNLFEIIAHLQEAEGISLGVRKAPSSRKAA